LEGAGQKVQTTTSRREQQHNAIYRILAGLLAGTRFPKVVKVCTEVMIEQRD
jgi:hypothetical protein